jgi:CheY-like chemotaxis protein
MADDDTDDQMLTKDAFRHAVVSEEIRFVTNGEDLLKYLRANGSESPRPKLILLDLNMPRKNGIEALQEIKADPGLRSIPVVVLTTSSADSDVAKSYELGAASFITKPASMASYVDMVRNLGQYWFDTVTLGDGAS